MRSLIAPAFGSFVDRAPFFVHTEGMNKSTLAALKSELFDSCTLDDASRCDYLIGQIVFDGARDGEFRGLCDGFSVSEIRRLGNALPVRSFYSDEAMELTEWLCSQCAGTDAPLVGAGICLDCTEQNEESDFAEMDF